MNISKYNTVIVLISSILTLYVFPIENSSSKNIDSTKTLYFETKQKSYLGKTGKTINLKFNFAWSICDANKLPEFPERIKKRTWEIRTSQILGDEIRSIASSSISFSNLNTSNNKKIIINNSNKISGKYGICFNSLKLIEVNGV